MSAFILNAETPQDIQLAIQFAKKHNLGISVINTGHELHDRNSGPGPNTFMIRTTCFRDWYPLRHSHESSIITAAHVGAGLSFGTNFWPELENAEGLYELAASVNREIVGGT